MTHIKNSRIASIDILRGIAIFGMILCGNIGFNSGLPGWMFHCQTPPPTYAFDPTNVGITWVDLVFPFFLFTMGAAFPLSMRKKIENGTSKWAITGNLFRRWLTLTIFALVLGNGYQTGQSTRPELLKNLYDIALWGVMFMALVRTDNRHINNAGMFLLVAMAFIRIDYFGVPLNRWTCNIIIMILANIALYGGLIWMFTRNSLRMRVLVLLFIAAIKGLASYAPETLAWAPRLTAIGWFFNWKFMQYLFIATAGSIAGDMLLDYSRSGVKAVIGNRHIAAGFVAIAAAVVQLWGLYTRNVFIDFTISAALAGAFVLLTIRNRNIMTNIGYMGFILMLAGIALDPVDGGITKDHCNLSYLFTTSGMAALTTSFLLMLEIRWQIKGRGLSGSGQNPMLAYTVTSFLTGPVLAIIGVGAWLDTICLGSPFWGIVRGLVYTLLMVAVTCFFTSRKLFWRS